MRTATKSLARKFRTEKAELLALDLEQFSRDIEAQARNAERGSEKRLSISKQVSDTSSVKALFGEVTRVAPTSAQTVYLPRATPHDTGLWVGIERVAGSGAVTVAPTDSTINGASTWALPYSIGVTLVWFDGTNWSTIGGSTGGELPVGSVYIAVVDTDPATLLGYGTWAAIGAGRVLVGQDTTQIWCDVLEETGGSSEHDHTLAAHTHTITHTHAGPSHVHTGPLHSHSILHTHAHNHRHSLPFAFSAGNIVSLLSNSTLGDTGGRIAYWSSTTDTTGSYSWLATAGLGGGAETTGGASTGTSGNEGNGNTGSGGTGNTGASSAANTGSSGTLTTGSTDHRMEYLVVKMWKRTA